MPRPRDSRTDFRSRLHRLVDGNDLQSRLGKLFQFSFILCNEFRGRRKTFNNRREYICRNRGDDGPADILQLSCLHLNQFHLLTDSMHFLRVYADALYLLCVFRRLRIVLQRLRECHAAHAERVHDEFLPIPCCGGSLVSIRQILQLFIQR